MEPVKTVTAIAIANNSLSHSILTAIAISGANDCK